MKLAFPQHAELSTSLSMRRPCLPHAVSARGKQVSACGNGPPHAEHESPHAETFLRTRSPHVLRMRNTDLRMRKRFSARGTPISACGDGPPHAEHDAETFLCTRNTGLRTRNTSLHIRKRFSACGSTRHAEDNEKSAVLGFRRLAQ